MDYLIGTEHNTHLVLYIEEKNLMSGTDTKLYITYDQSTETYIVTGQREKFKDISPVPYKLRFEDNYGVCQFLNKIIGDRVSITIYNYNDLCDDFSNNITYSFLEDKADDKREIVAHDNVKLCKTSARDWLDIIRNAFNYDTEMEVF